MKTIFKVMTAFSILAFSSVGSARGSYLFESMMSYKRGDCIDTDRVVILNNFISGFYLLMGTSADRLDAIDFKPGERRLFITVLKQEPSNTDKQRPGISRVSNVLFASAGNAVTRLEGGNLYIIDESGSEKLLIRVPTVCRDGELQYP